jgi:molybdopterin synthase catalytic subunit
MIRVTRDDFSVDEELKLLIKPSVGGLVTFVGTVRDESEAGHVERMEIEVYPEMAEIQLTEIREEAMKKFDVEDILVIHRYGDLRVGENIVLVAVSAGHREAAFNACSYIIDELKKKVPIWKREHTPTGAHWVEAGRIDEY